MGNNLNLYISAPFGNYIHAKKAISTIGSYTLQHRPGRATQILKTLRYDFKHKCWYNALGLRNPGIDSLDLQHHEKEPAEWERKVLSIAAIESSDWSELYSRTPPYVPLELNISCPNIPHRNHLKYIEIFSERKNVIVKTYPHMTDEELVELYTMGFHKFHCCNTLPTLHGGRSGEILREYVIEQITFLKNLDESVYCIAGGGIQNQKDIDNYLNIGADACSLGTVCFNPYKLWRLIG